MRETILTINDIKNGEKWFIVNLKSGIIVILDYSDNELHELKTISTTSSEKGYFALDTFSDYPYFAVSYNDNYDSEDEAK